jgi:hypothetical protein
MYSSSIIEVGTGCGRSASRPGRFTPEERDPGNRCIGQRSPTDGPRENFGGPWRNLDIICNFYVYYIVSLYFYII